MLDDSEAAPLATIPEPRLQLLLSICGSPAHWDKRTIPVKALVEPHEVAILCRYMLSHYGEERLRRLRARRG